ncbi:MAG: hypothetical protein GTO14_13155 [Anaerolineales bacterium]|nr:hypothetical protein [Anaerolineales bacterium]
MKRKMLFLIALMATFLASCSTSETATRTPTHGAPQPDPTSTATERPVSVDITQLNVQNYPRVDGSTSAYPLQITIACRIFALPCHWLEGDLFDPTRRIGLEPLLSGSDETVEKLYSIQHNGTHGSYMNLIDGHADIILVARTPSKDEFQAAEGAGVVLEVVPVALDAFVFLVNAENPVDDLTLEEIRAIYTGEITQWSDLGEIVGEIQPYQRNPNSGSQELMESLVMRGRSMIDSPDMILMSMMGPINAISEDPYGLGYSVYFYATYIFPHERVKRIAIDGVYPNSDTIANRSYPLTTEVYAVVRQDTSPQSTARLLLNWLLTDEGQGVIAQSGYVPLRGSQLAVP